MRPLRALFIEDSEDDVLLLLRELARCGYAVTHERVETAAGLRKALARGGWELVLADYHLPGFSPLEALALLKESGQDLPFLLISGAVGEESAVDALKAGAHDFLVKGRLARLGPAIERELREAQMRAERRLAEEALRASEARYRRIVETAQEGVWVVDRELCTTFVNRRLAAMLGTTAEAMLGTSIFDYLDDAWKQVARRQLHLDLGTELAPCDFKYRRADGGTFWASLSISRILDEAGEFVGGLAMVTDVTEQRNLQAQLMTADRMASVGILAAGVAHELNTPLAAVVGNLDLAQQALQRLGPSSALTTDAAELVDELRDARDAAERMRQIVRDLRVFSRAEEDERGPVDVVEVLESTLRVAWSELRHRAHVVREYRKVPAVGGNAGRLGQVFLNLIVNATQALPEDATRSLAITLGTGLDGQGRVVVTVRDDGAGMSQEVLDRIFTPFYTTKPVGVGTGLGLYICQRIVSALGGEIAVESQEGRGTTVRVALQPAVAVAAVAAPPTPEPRETARRGRILVVDDEPVILSVMRRYLGRQHEVVGLTSAREALELLASGARFDVILCDLMMPEMTGMQFHAELARTASDAAERTIFMSGGTTTQTARAFLQQVGNAQVDKPFDLPLLQRLVAERVRG
ncbi:MAG: response regulator [Deltaproteobacteria bacterium]|nr:response regulator [Deltaproteobacteria bacterium]